MSFSNPTCASPQESAVNLTVVNPPGLYDPAPNGYSHAVVAGGGARIAYIAGQRGEHATGDPPPGASLRRHKPGLFLP